MIWTEPKQELLVSLEKFKQQTKNYHVFEHIGI